MRDQRDRPGRKLRKLHGTARREHDAVGDIDEPDGVGTKQAHASGRLLEFLLAALAVGTGLAKTAGEHDCGGRTGAGKLAHGLDHAVRSEQHEPHVGRRRQRAHRRIARQAGEFLIARVDRIDRARKAVTLQIIDGAAGELARIRRRAQYGDAPRIEQPVEHVGHSGTTTISFREMPPPRRDARTWCSRSPALRARARALPLHPARGCGRGSIWRAPTLPGTRC